MHHPLFVITDPLGNQAWQILGEHKVAVSCQPTGLVEIAVLGKAGQLLYRFIAFLAGLRGK